MITIEFFKQQAKSLLKDYNTKVYNEDEGFYEYSPRFFHDIDEIVMNFDIDEEGSFTLMNAQHVIAKLSGFYKWTELIKASSASLELGKLLLDNRIAYQEKLGLFTNMVESIIVADWKDYEQAYLSDADDETKLEVFKEVFLSDAPKKRKAPTLSINYADDEIAQDMICTIMKEKNLTPAKAILSSITQRNCVTILSTGWAGIAVSHWGHANPDREWQTLENPVVELKLSKDKERLVAIVMEKEKISLAEALQYFMIFSLEALGYHI
ncbi:MAG: hypothetical protein IJW64_06970 [Clostridia bacterium]|nr:hypothetical protein [Clostridia bacterium]